MLAFGFVLNSGALVDGVVVMGPLVSCVGMMADSSGGSCVVLVSGGIDCALSFEVEVPWAEVTVSLVDGGSCACPLTLDGHHSH